MAATPTKTSATMNGCEKTEEGVHPLKVLLCPQLVIQTKAQRLDFDPEDDGRSFCGSVQSLDSGVFMETLGSFASSVLSMKSDSSLDCFTDFKGIKQRSASPTPSSASESRLQSMEPPLTFNNRTLPLELKGQSSTPDIGITHSDNMTGAAVLQVLQFDSQTTQSTWRSVIGQDGEPQIAFDGCDLIHTKMLAAWRTVISAAKLQRPAMKIAGRNSLCQDVILALMQAAWQAACGHTRYHRERCSASCHTSWVAAILPVLLFYYNASDAAMTPAMQTELTECIG